MNNFGGGLVARSLRPRKTVALCDSLHQRLNMYAAAAGAAGVGLLALSQSAEGKIVYTPAHVVIPRGYPGVVLLDLNHDGIAYFMLENWWNNDPDGYTGSLEVFPAHPGNGNGILGYGTADKLGWLYFASALRAGARIGPGRRQSFFSAKYADWLYRVPSWGQWKDVRNRYLGLEFMIEGKTHYGWARLNVFANVNTFKITAVVTGYAYETTPNKAIIAGRTKEQGDAEQPAPTFLKTRAEESATLGALALGTPGLSFCRPKAACVRHIRRQHASPDSPADGMSR
jgi:hypothetical protein